MYIYRSLFIFWSSTGISAWFTVLKEKFIINWSFIQPLGSASETGCSDWPAASQQTSSGSEGNVNKQQWQDFISFSPCSSIEMETSQIHLYIFEPEICKGIMWTTGGTTATKSPLFTWIVFPCHIVSVLLTLQLFLQLQATQKFNWSTPNAIATLSPINDVYILPNCFPN